MTLPAAQSEHTGHTIVTCLPARLLHTTSACVPARLHQPNNMAASFNWCQLNIHRLLLRTYSVSCDVNWCLCCIECWDCLDMSVAEVFWYGITLGCAFYCCVPWLRSELGYGNTHCIYVRLQIQQGSSTMYTFWLWWQPSRWIIFDQTIFSHVFLFSGSYNYNLIHVIITFDSLMKREIKRHKASNAVINTNATLVTQRRIWLVVMAQSLCWLANMERPVQRNRARSWSQLFLSRMLSTILHNFFNVMTIIIIGAKDWLEHTNGIYVDFRTRFSKLSFAINPR